MNAWGGGPDARAMFAPVPIGQPPRLSGKLLDRCLGQSVELTLERADDVL
jgi:hypothetical protein